MIFRNGNVKQSGQPPHFFLSADLDGLTRLPVLGFLPNVRPLGGAFLRPSANMPRALFLFVATGLRARAIRSQRMARAFDAAFSFKRFFAHATDSSSSSSSSDINAAEATRPPRFRTLSPASRFHFRIIAVADAERKTGPKRGFSSSSESESATPFAIRAAFCFSSSCFC